MSRHWPFTLNAPEAVLPPGYVLPSTAPVPGNPAARFETLTPPEFRYFTHEEWRERVENAIALCESDLKSGKARTYAWVLAKAAELHLLDHDNPETISYQVARPEHPLMRWAQGMVDMYQGSVERWLQWADWLASLSDTERQRYILSQLPR